MQSNLLYNSCVVKWTQAFILSSRKEFVVVRYGNFLFDTNNVGLDYDKHLLNTTFCSDPEGITVIWILTGNGIPSSLFSAQTRVPDF